MQYQAPKGVFDILPPYLFEKPSFQNIELWQKVESAARKIAKTYNFTEIRTPIFEHTEVFTRSSGETSDIVSKEMYTFSDKGDRSLTLRPEGTASVARAVVENQLLRKKGIQKLFYIGPFFRYDRPQAGRYRQFHQFGVEVFGIKDPELDAEIICMLMDFYKELGIGSLTVLINSIGDAESRENYKSALVNYLLPKKDQLSLDSQLRLEKNPLRILDSKDKNDQLALVDAPKLGDFLNESSKAHFDKVCATLKALNIPYVISDKLVRGLDYYNQTVFEIVTEKVGAQNTIGAGGRYDGLLEKLNGQDAPSFGFATGIERTILTMLEQNIIEPSKSEVEFFFIPLDESSKIQCMTMLAQLRSLFIPCEILHKSYKIQKGFQQALEEKAKFVIIAGEQELKNECVKIKNLELKEEVEVKLEDFLQFCKKHSKSEIKTIS